MDQGQASRQMETFAAPRTTRPAHSGGTHDGIGAGDNNSTFEFGGRPCANVPFPFTTHQYARLLILRSRIEAGLTAVDDQHDAHPLVFLGDGVWVASAADLIVGANR